MQMLKMSEMNMNTRLSLNGTPFAGIDLVRVFIATLGHDLANNTAIIAGPRVIGRSRLSGYE